LAIYVAAAVVDIVVDVKRESAVGGEGERERERERSEKALESMNAGNLVATDANKRT
jgi:hypothetical protein